jgi:hypothetical protein
MGSLTVEDRLKVALRDQEHLKEALRMKTSVEEDLQRDISFYQIKNQELTDVLNAIQSNTNGVQQQVMRAKAEQNAELSIQVRALKDLLNKSTETIDLLQKKLSVANEEKEKLASGQKSYERAIAQINGLYNTVNMMEISSMKSMKSEWINSRWIAKPCEGQQAHATVQCISRKIIAVESDRQRLLCEIKSYQEDHVKEEERSESLERQVKLLEQEKQKLREETHALQRELDVRAGKIGALEELFQTINTTRTLDIPENVEYNRDVARYEAISVIEEDEKRTFVENGAKSNLKLDDEESVDIFSQAASSVGAAFSSMMESLSFDVQSISTDKMEDIFTVSTTPPEFETADAISFHTKDVEQELYQAAMIEAQEWKDKYLSVQDDHSQAKLKIANLSVQVQDLEQEVFIATKKADLREGLLRDIIQQYKELEHEHTHALEQVGKLKDKVARLAIKQYKQEKKEKESFCHEKGKGNENNDYHNFLDDRLPTFETEASGITMDDDFERLQDDSSSPTSLNTNNDEDRSFLDEYKKLESECDRLQHEFETAIAKISNLEKELELARMQVHASHEQHAKQAYDIAVLEKDKSQLHEQLLEEKQKLSNWKSTHEGQQADDLRAADLRTEQARSKQREREQDLWDVIEQYKSLAELNAEQEEHMNNIERELHLTHRVQIQRRDLVYEYRKLERGKINFPIKTKNACIEKLIFVLTFLLQLWKKPWKLYGS